MTNQEKMLRTWHSIQADPKSEELSLWKRVELLAKKMKITPHGARRFLLRNGEYELIITTHEKVI